MISHEQDMERVRGGIDKEEFPRGSETLLIVEDNEAVRKLAIHFLRRQGYEVLEASNGSEALTVCKLWEKPVHLVVTDVEMPEMNGPELAECLQTLYPETKVLYISGYPDNAFMSRGILEKGINFLKKPFRLEELAKKVREALEK